MLTPLCAPSAAHARNTRDAAEARAKQRSTRCTPRGLRARQIEGASSVLQLTAGQQHEQQQRRRRHQRNLMQQTTCMWTCRRARGGAHAGRGGGAKARKPRTRDPRPSNCAPLELRAPRTARPQLGALPREEAVDGSAVARAGVLRRRRPVLVRPEVTSATCTSTFSNEADWGAGSGRGCLPTCGTSMTAS
eukprot:365856-Chlamydomonas_euryale.AAC.12